MRVIDWYGYSANRNDLFDGDGIHLSNTGVTEYLQLIDDQVARYLPIHLEDGDDERLLIAQHALDSLKTSIGAEFAHMKIEGDTE